MNVQKEGEKLCCIAITGPGDAILTDSDGCQAKISKSGQFLEWDDSKE
jgi:hypothetical protein